MVRVETAGTSIEARSPYNPSFVDGARALGGKFDRGEKVWRFDARSEQAVRDLCRKVYGTDGEDEDLVTVEITFAATYGAWQDGYYFAGRQLARAWGRDSGARIGEGVVFLEGKPTSGGSMKNWETVIGRGSVVRIYDLPRAALDNAPRDPDIKWRIVEEADDRRASLEAERERLRKRLGEIEAELAGL